MSRQSGDSWIDQVIERHTAAMTRPEFLKAVRALSARYVEQRASLADRSPLDSAGKRAAFAGFYAPLHFLTVREVVRRLGAGLAQPKSIVDAGCGTGVAGAAWALECDALPLVAGVDLNAWVLEEAHWNWKVLGFRGRTRRGDLVAALAALRNDEAVICGWSLNELDAAARDRAIAAILARARSRSPVPPILIVEPIATRAVPWWPAFATAAAAAGARLDEWKFDFTLPPALATLDEAAGFRRDGLNARSAAFGIPNP